MARKRKWIDRKLMKQLAQAQLTNEEIAVALRVSHDTIERRYACAIKEWKRTGVGSMRRRLFTLAQGEDKGAVTALIFFLKNFGGMADVSRDASKGAEFGDLPRTEFKPVEISKPN